MAVDAWMEWMDALKPCIHNIGPCDPPCDQEQLFYDDSTAAGTDQLADLHILIDGRPNLGFAIHK